MRVGIYVYDEVEVLDFAGPYEVFSTASRVLARSQPSAPAPFEPCLVAASKALVHARAGFPVQPHFTIDEHPPLEVLVVPGGV
jgi:transcriptional regulator GlxA family with amidase domain